MIARAAGPVRQRISSGSARGVLVPALAVAVAFLVLAGLGTWQLRRLAWKEQLIAAAALRAGVPTQDVPPPSLWAGLNRARDEYLHVRARGTFDHARETLVYAVRGADEGPPAGPGAFVVTPLVRAEGPPILVNRGFVPQARRDPASRAEGQTTGEVEVTGLLRLPEEPSWFVPANDAARGAFYRLDPASIAAARGLAGAAPFIIDLDAGSARGGLPVAGTTRLSFPNRHLEYALTWYALAATLLAVSLAALWRRRQR